MRPAAALLLSVAALGCGGAHKTAEPPAPTVEPARTAPSATFTPIHYRVRAPQVYEVARYDSLFYDPQGGGTAQASDKVGLLVVRPVSTRENGELEVVLQSLEAGPGTRLAVSSLDSATAARWHLTLGPSGAEGVTTGESRNVLADQMWVIGRLLFPQLPRNGLPQVGGWSDSTSYPLRVDAFDAIESAARTSRAEPTTNGVRVEASERLRRSGGVTQGGQAMSLSGGGGRWLSYDFGTQGLVTSLTARDSLDLRVRVEATGQIIPVRWRSTLTARLRGASPR